MPINLLVQALNLQPYSCIGWSEGGRTSLHIAHQERANIRKLVVFAAGVIATTNGVQMFKSSGKGTIH